MAVDFNGLEQGRQTCRGHQRIDIDLRVFEDFDLPGFDIRCGQKELPARFPLNLLEVEKAFDELTEWIEVKRVDVIGRQFR